MEAINNRFMNAVHVVKTSGTQAETLSTTAKAVAGSTVTLETQEAADGMCFEWMIAGTKSSTNGAFTVTLVGNGTTLLTLTADAVTASDWVANITLRFTNPKVQKLIGSLVLDTEDPEVNYAAGTTNFSGGGSILAYVTCADGRDTVDAEMCIVKRYKG